MSHHLAFNDMLNQDGIEFIYNISIVDDSRIKLLAGEGGRLLQIGTENFVYQGGFMGNRFNFRIGLFQNNYGSETDSISYISNHDNNTSSIARMGHLMFYDSYLDKILIFGGQRSGDKFKSTNARLMMNDIVLYDYKNMDVHENIQFSEGAIPSRIYSVGFKIDQKIFVIGGMASNGHLLNDFIEVDYANKTPKDAIVEKGKNLLQEMHSSALCAVFYKSKLGDYGDLRLSSITGETNWGETVDLIKHEGFYIFGGRKSNNDASGMLLIFKISMDKKHIGRPCFKIFRPKTTGEAPCARYMHTMNHIPNLNQVVLYGGRNDFLPKGQILGDIFLLKLHSMEWVKVLVGGDLIPSERCNHSALVNGTELIICGGQNG